MITCLTSCSSKSCSTLAGSTITSSSILTIRITSTIINCSSSSQKTNYIERFSNEIIIKSCRKKDKSQNILTSTPPNLAQKSWRTVTLTAILRNIYELDISVFLRKRTRTTSFSSRLLALKESLNYSGNQLLQHVLSSQVPEAQEVAPGFEIGTNPEPTQV